MARRVAIDSWERPDRERTRMIDGLNVVVIGAAEGTVYCFSLATMPESGHIRGGQPAVQSYSINATIWVGLQPIKFPMEENVCNHWTKQR